MVKVCKMTNLIPKGISRAAMFSQPSKCVGPHLDHCMLYLHIFPRGVMYTERCDKFLCNLSLVANGLAYFSATPFPKEAWSVRKGKAS